MYTLSHHARLQCQAKGFNVDAVLLAAARPLTTYPNHRPGCEHQVRHIRDGIVAVVDPAKRTVVTVYLNVVETPLRPDQVLA